MSRKFTNYVERSPLPYHLILFADSAIQERHSPLSFPKLPEALSFFARLQIEALKPMIHFL